MLLYILFQKVSKITLFSTASRTYWGSKKKAEHQRSVVGHNNQNLALRIKKQKSWVLWSQGIAKGCTLGTCAESKQHKNEVWKWLENNTMEEKGVMGELWLFQAHLSACCHSWSSWHSAASQEMSQTHPNQVVPSTSHYRRQITQAIRVHKAGNKSLSLW